MSAVKLCIDCKHAVTGGDPCIIDLWKCLAKKKVEPVLGKVYVGLLRCSEERRQGGICGPEGTFWEARD